MTRLKKCASFDGERPAAAVALIGAETRATARHLSDAGATALGANWTVWPNLPLYAPVSFRLAPKLQRLSSVHASLHIELSASPGELRRRGVNPGLVRFLRSPSDPRKAVCCLFNWLAV